jgi:hypothetical protein
MVSFWFIVVFTILLESFRPHCSLCLLYNRTNGRWNIGPRHKFIKYQADAHYEYFDELSVFSAGGANESLVWNSRSILTLPFS